MIDFAAQELAREFHLPAKVVGVGGMRVGAGLLRLVDGDAGDAHMLGIDLARSVVVGQVPGDADRDMFEDEPVKGLVMLQLLPDAVPLGDIGFDGHVTGDGAVGVAQWLHFDVRPVGALIFRVVDDFDVETLLRSERVVHLRHRGGRSDGALEKRTRLPALDFGERVAGDPGEAVVDPFDVTRGVGDDDAVGRRARDEREAAVVRGGATKLPGHFRGQLVGPVARPG